MSPTESSKASTVKGWRDLGFFYDYDEEEMAWYLIGSKSGLGNFQKLLLDYVADPKNKKKSEHSHYGPYMYLEVMTWDKADINEHAIQGPIDDLKRLAEIVGKKLEESLPNETFSIREEYSKDAGSSIIFEIREEGFDPSSADDSLKNEA